MLGASQWGGGLYYNPGCQAPLEIAPHPLFSHTAHSADPTPGVPPLSPDGTPTIYVLLICSYDVVLLGKRFIGCSQLR
jgi:hypothetical protein